MLRGRQGHGIDAERIEKIFFDFAKHLVRLTDFNGAGLESVAIAELSDARHVHARDRCAAEVYDHAVRGLVVQSAFHSFSAIHGCPVVQISRRKVEQHSDAAPQPGALGNPGLLARSRAPAQDRAQPCVLELHGYIERVDISEQSELAVARRVRRLTWSSDSTVGRARYLAIFH